MLFEFIFVMTKRTAAGTREEEESRATVDEISPDFDEQDFFEQYVRCRLPVRINGLLEDADWKGGVWNNSYLREKSGDEEVRVEYREADALAETRRFGQGKEKRMKFGE